MRFLFWVSSVASTGCAATVDTEVTDNGTFSSELRSTPEEVGALRLLNLPTTDVSLLDIDAALDRRVAANLIARRDGVDGRSGTRDDGLFEDHAAVDAVPYRRRRTLALRNRGHL